MTAPAPFGSPHDHKDEATVAFVTLLRACTKRKDLRRGIKVHQDFLRLGLLETYLDPLVVMYAKCGALGQAKELFDMHKSRDPLTWTAMILGYSQNDQGQDAIGLFERMQDEALSPDAITFTCTLKACGSVGAIDEGEKIHDEIAKQGLLEKDVVLGTALVDMYAKCGALEKARQVLEGLPKKNVISWTALITGYAEQGDGEEVLKCYERMQWEGLSPNAVTFISILKACGSLKAMDRGARIHEEIATMGLLGNNILLGTALVGMYAKCGALSKARRVLEELPVRDVISWNALITGYAQHGELEQALLCLERMHHDHLFPNAVTYTCIVKACGRIGAADKGAKMYEQVVKHGFLRKNKVLCNAFIEMYAKCGALQKAREVLEELCVQDVSSWNALIAAYVQQDQGQQALECYEEMQHKSLSPDSLTFVFLLQACANIGAAHKGSEIYHGISKRGLLRNNIVLGTAVVDMYAKCGDLAKAWQVLQELPARSTVCWSALIAGYAENGDGEQALNCFEHMLHEGFSPDKVTFICLLKACGSINAADKGEKLHDEIVKQGMLGSDVVIGTALVDMYAKCGALARARRVLLELPIRNVVSWTALIAGYAQQGDGEEALICFEQMQREGLSPDKVTFLCILKACGSIGASDKGEKIHDEIAKQGILENDVELGNSLVDMYAKCNALSKARQVLVELPVRDVVSWNAVIAGYVEQCESEQAIECMEVMQRDGLSPDMATFSSVLSACSRMGLVEDAHMYFVEMSTKFGMKPNLDHHTCMIDLFARAGRLDRAVGVIEKLATSNGGVWSALLGACEKWGDVNVARWAFEHGVRVDRTDAGFYTLMANIYAAAGMQEDVNNIEALRIKNKAWNQRARNEAFGSPSSGDTKLKQSNHLYTEPKNHSQNLSTPNPRDRYSKQDKLMFEYNYKNILEGVLVLR